MKRLLFLLLPLILVCCGKKDMLSFEGGTLQRVDSLKVLNVYGSWEQMGRQYGHLVSDHMRHILEVGIEPGAKADSVKAEKAKAIADSLYARYPQRLKSFFKGMEQTSGFTMDELKAINAMEYTDWILNCSGLAVWGDYTKDGELLYGRNYDAGNFHKMGQDIIVTIFHPNDGALATALVGYAGEIYCVNGMNENGIFIELNSGAPSTGFSQDFLRSMGTTSLLSMLPDATDMDYVDAFFRCTSSSSGFIIGCADKDGALKYEWCQDGSVKVEGEENYMVMTNHYVSDKWNFPVPVDSASWKSFTRLSHLQKIAQDGKGEFDQSLMQKAFETSLEDGGATVEATEYQLIACPARRSWTIRIPGYCDWTEVKLF